MGYLLITDNDYFTKDSKILSVWIDNKEYVINPTPKIDISGEWIFQDSSYKAIIKSENNKFKITLEVDTTKVATKNVDFKYFFYEKILYLIGSISIKFDLFIYGKKLQIGKKYKVWGKIRFLIDGNGMIKIGERFHAVSSRKRSYITIFSPCHLTSIHGGKILIGNHVGLNGNTIVSRKNIEIDMCKYIFKNKIDKDIYSKLGTRELLELHKAITLFLQTDENLLPTIKKAFDTTCYNIIKNIKKKIEFNNILYGDLISYTRDLTPQYIWITRLICNKNFKHFNPQCVLLTHYLNYSSLYTLCDE